MVSNSYNLLKKRAEMIKVVGLPLTYVTPQ